MPSWLASLLFAVLVVTIPFTLILTIMQRLPKAVVLSHRRWPLPLNYILIGTITAYVTIFIRTAYYVRGADPAAAAGFARLHRLSSILNVIVMVSGILVVVIETVRRR